MQYSILSAQQQILAQFGWQKNICPQERGVDQPVVRYTNNIVAVYLNATFACKVLQKVHNKLFHISSSSCCFILFGWQEGIEPSECICGVYPI
jgi:hypothetical protein